ncbi:hypothetical protein [Legionella maioricensis]|uniref:Uncharacterized protein n=1 Tax=Legionella maioricensis TaxID=2896528 RepID=A0A9X2CY04_9GAMM|nr:hypothetical protein [Legionella maioricensis]MCL9682560.1 hypothetical protein [Legionella maioricensis]MCL9686193.1 hypothetical protein [Legionella maioricensis]
MSLKRFILIPGLTTFYSDATCSKKIAEALKKAISGKYYLIYPNLAAAQRDKPPYLKKHMATAGIIELEIEEESQLSEDNILKFCEKVLTLPTDKERAKKCSSLIEAVYVKGFKLPFNQLDVKAREIAQITSFNSVNDSTLQLTLPPLLYLKQIHPELHFLLFTDHQFFLNFENWRHYNAREARGKGCVYDLFQATTSLCKLLPQLLKNFTLEDIKAVQKLLSDSVFYGSTEDRRGIFRQDYNAFPLHPDAATVDGIKELLQRIKSDNQANGFRIGFVNRSTIVSSFCRYMSLTIREEKLWKKFPDEMDKLTPEMLEKLKELEKKAIAEMRKTKDIAVQDIEVIINDFLKDFEPSQRVSLSSFWGNLSYYYSDLANEFSRKSTKLELQYDLRCGRAHALASAGDVEDSAVNIKDFADTEIDALAKNIYTRIQLSNDIYLFTPEPKLAEKWANVALGKYHSTISQAKSPMGVIEVVDELVHELEILHLFHDVNCRTNDLWKNFLFLAHSIKWATEFNPNRLDAYSRKERVQQHIQGILRTDYIIEHQEQLLQDNRRIDLIYLANRAGLQTVDYSAEELSQVKTDLQYQEISQQLAEELEAYEKIVQQKLGQLIKKYDLQSHSKLSSTSAVIFSIPPGYLEFAEALKQFQINYDTPLFFKRVAYLHTVPEIAEDIEILMSLTGFNCELESDDMVQSAENCSLLEY